MEKNYIVVYVTVPDESAAKSIADSILGDRLAACCNILPSIRSLYRWKGEIQDDSELLLIFKTKAALFEKLSASVKASHPYEVPEIIAIPIADGSADYLAWIDENVIKKF